MHTILKYKSFIVHVPWGVPSLFLEHLVDLIIISSCAQLFFLDLLIACFFVNASFLCNWYPSSGFQLVSFLCNLWILNIV